MYSRLHFKYASHVHILESETRALFLFLDQLKSTAETQNSKTTGRRRQQKSQSCSVISIFFTTIGLELGSQPAFSNASFLALSDIFLLCCACCPSF